MWDAYCLVTRGPVLSANPNVTRDAGHGARGSLDGGLQTICRDDCELLPCSTSIFRLSPAVGISRGQGREDAVKQRRSTVEQECSMLLLHPVAALNTCTYY